MKVEAVQENLGAYLSSSNTVCKRLVINKSYRVGSWFLGNPIQWRIFNMEKFTLCMMQ